MSGDQKKTIEQHASELLADLEKGDHIAFHCHPDHYDAVVESLANVKAKYPDQVTVYGLSFVGRGAVYVVNKTVHDDLYHTKPGQKYVTLTDLPSMVLKPPMNLGGFCG